MPKKAWSHLRSSSKEGRRAAADKCATRSFLPDPAETPAAAAPAAAAAAVVAVVSSGATSTTTTTTTDDQSCRHPPPPHTGNGDSGGSSSSSLGGALERSHASRGGEKTDPIRASPAEAAQGGQDIAVSPRGGATPGSPGGKRSTRGRSPTRVRHPRDPTSPETAYRSAVQGYLEPPKIAKGDATTPKGRGNTSSQSNSHRKTRSVSPAGRSVWCSPARPDEPCAGAAAAAATATPGSPRAAPGSPRAGLKEKVSPLLLAPSDWGIGLSGEWVPAHGGPRVVRAVGRVSLTWADIRGSTLLHLAAQHNDVALIKAVLECERKRKKALQVAERRKERVLARARKRAERSQNEFASRRPDVSSPTSKEVSRRIKKNQAVQKNTASSDKAGAPSLESDDDRNVDGKTPPAVASIDNGHIASGDWLPLQASDGGGDGKGRGAVVVNKLRSVLEEAHVRKVARLAGFYLTGAVNEADWYHRTDTILPITESRQLLVEIAAAHPSDTWERRAGKAAIQDYAEEERSKADGGFWMDKGIKDALDLNARNQPGETPLILGAQNGSLECVAALLEEADTDVTAANGDGCTALVMAAMLDKTGMVKVLVAAHSSRGVGVNHRTANGYSALHWAVVRGNLDAAIDLVDAAASVNTGRTDRRKGMWRLPIHKCAEYGSTKCFLVLLKAGADPLMEDNLGMTPMHIAARKGFVEIMRCLSEGEHAAVSVNVVSKKNGKTPLHYSVEHLQLESARYILDSAEGKAEAIKHLDGSQRAKLETMLAAAEKEKRGVVASAAASFSEFVHKVFL